MTFNTKIRFSKVSTVPVAQDWTPNTLYFVPSATSGVMDAYLTSNDGLSIRHLIKQSEINDMITNAINTALTANGTVIVVADIAARNALSFSTTRYVYVESAIDDVTVTSGGATYMYVPTKPDNQKWIKTSEAESLDLVVSWAALQGKPTSTVAQIDGAVSKAHEHNNLTLLETLTVDANGDLLVNNALPHTGWEQTAW